MFALGASSACPSGVWKATLPPAHLRAFAYADLSLWRILALLTPLATTEVSYPPGCPSLDCPYRVVSQLLRGLISVDRVPESFIYYCHLPLWKCKQASTGFVCHPVSEPQRVPRKC